MTDVVFRRRLYRHGFLLLLLSFVLGFVTAAGGPHARQWLVAHVSGILAGILLVALGAVWPELRLGPGQRRLTYWSALASNYLAFFLLGLYAAAIGAPLDVVAPGPPLPAAQMIPIVLGIVIVSLTTLIYAALTVYGLRAEPQG
jgi:hydroxylaminobenzene mutase